MFELFVKHLRVIIVWAVVVGALSFGVSLLFPRQYSAESQVLIISRDRSGVDPYTQAKSAERIGENLAQVMGTDDFYSKVMEATNTSFDKSRWAIPDQERRKLWQKDVEPEVVYNTSLLKVTVYSSTKEDAVAFSNAVTDVVVSRGWEYIGGDVALKAVDRAIVPEWPTRPDLLVNTVLGFVVGGIIGMLWVMRYRHHTVFGRL